MTGDSGAEKEQGNNGLHLRQGPWPPRDLQRHPRQHAC